MQIAVVLNGAWPPLRVAATRRLAHTLVAMPDDSIASDEDLMERFRDGDAGAFDLLYARHKGGVFRFMARQCSDRGIAEELFQDVWMNLIRARDAYTVTAKFTTYLYKLAHNRLIDHYRSRAGGVPLSFDAEDGPALDNVAAARSDDPAVSADLRQQAGRLLQLLADLPEAQREAFLL